MLLKLLLFFNLILGCYHLKLLILDYINNQVRVVTDRLVENDGENY